MRGIPSCAPAAAAATKTVKLAPVVCLINQRDRSGRSCGVDRQVSCGRFCSGSARLEPGPRWRIPRAPRRFALPATKLCARAHRAMKGLSGTQSRRPNTTAIVISIRYWKKKPQMAEACKSRIRPILVGGASLTRPPRRPLRRRLVSHLDGGPGRGGPRTVAAEFPAI